jgi:hypothetical protein
MELYDIKVIGNKVFYTEDTPEGIYYVFSNGRLLVSSWRIYTSDKQYLVQVTSPDRVSTVIAVDKNSVNSYDELYLQVKEVFTIDSPHKDVL